MGIRMFGINRPDASVELKRLQHSNFTLMSMTHRVHDQVGVICTALAWTQCAELLKQA